MTQTRRDGTSYLDVNSLKNVTSFSFAVFGSKHTASRSCFLQCTVGSQFKQVRTVNNAAKLTVSAKWRLLNLVDGHFLQRQLEHRCARSVFSAVRVGQVRFSDLCTRQLTSQIYHAGEFVICLVALCGRKHSVPAIFEIHHAGVLYKIDNNK